MVIMKKLLVIDMCCYRLSVIIVLMMTLTSCGRCGLMPVVSCSKYIGSDLEMFSHKGKSEMEKRRDFESCISQSICPDEIKNGNLLDDTGHFAQYVNERQKLIIEKQKI
ncbi:Uncharacterised protein [Suttonella indologenes]|uniref:Uncharacterized protein n=2 Tax=Suttonella indologenes TaxID=13276 RepID=A0A380MKJ3_9GAMM|nr:Uncharacterised protein [Suttonella indologenes]